MFPGPGYILLFKIPIIWNTDYLSSTHSPRSHYTVSGDTVLKWMRKCALFCVCHSLCTGNGAEDGISEVTFTAHVVYKSNWGHVPAATVKFFSISFFFCILTYVIIYILIHHIIFWLYLYFLNILYFLSTPVLTSSIDVVLYFLLDKNIGTSLLFIIELYDNMIIVEILALSVAFHVKFVQNAIAIKWLVLEILRHKRFGVPCIATYSWLLR